MSSTDSQPDSQFVPLLVKGYLFGTFFSAIALHIAVSLIAPGGAGTMNALGDGAIFFVILIMLGLVGLVAFPVVSTVSWPFRKLVFEHPLLALFAATGTGLAVGAVLTATEFQMGPNDFWSGPVVGFVYGAVWFLVVRKSRPFERSDIA